jgi:oxygen-independent coproporphyrinogen-3 oxidase
MPAAPPEGLPAPTDGGLPEAALAELGRRPFGIYVHVPFCATRCGYCDFNTYTPGELAGDAVTGYVAAAVAELRLARRVLGDGAPAASTVFFGGGTPTFLAPRLLGEVMHVVRTEFGLARDAEVSCEANPETVDAAVCDGLVEIGVNRMSLGMQSARAHVLRVLDRVHTPGRAVESVAVARRAGIRQVNLDLIYGAPSESNADWLASLQAAVDSGVDHVSAYALTVEPGTRLAARVRRGELGAPDDDLQADRYLAAESMLGRAGLRWYEISNWAHTPADRCRHNLGYWTGADWWGVGPGAHSHVGGVRWWNRRHPADWRRALAAGESPAQARECLDEAARRLEWLMLGVRLADGLAADELDPGQRGLLDGLAADGLLEPAALGTGRLVLTLTGRLLADTVVRKLAG